MKKVLIFSITLMLITAAFSFSISTAASVDPVYVSGNPTCEDLGFDFGYKPKDSPPFSGNYPFPGDPSNSVTITSDGVYFDWASTLSIDAVIVKGGPNANVYYYNPESTGDSGLSSPDNNGIPYDISHIDFCYDYELDASKTAFPTFTRIWSWLLEKGVSPALWDLFKGDSGTSQYYVQVTKDGYTDSDWAVSGNINISNNTPFDATITGVSDSVGGVDASVVCGVEFPYVLPASNSLVCSYSTPLPDGSSRLNTATITTSGIVQGASANAGVVFVNPTNEVNGTINVDDTNGMSWTFSDSGTVTYDMTYTCDADEGSNPNVATIRETGQRNVAGVNVRCHDLEVTKDATPSYNTYYDWFIDKTADQMDLVLSVGQQFLVNYGVRLVARDSDADWAVAGNITISNPAPIDAVINSVSDVISPSLAAAVDCGVDFPYTLPAGGSLSCSYSSELPDGADRVNTATVTLQNFSYAYDLTATADGTTDYSATADILFGSLEPTDLIDDCVDVTDTYAGFLGTVCYNDSPKIFNYSRFIGPYDVCGLYQVPNIASYVTNDLGLTGSDGWHIDVEVPCLGGCSLTPGYWKTHSSLGPAPYDDTWSLLWFGEYTPFFLSNQSYYEVLWTNPKGGNAYYILAHAYIAVELNKLNGADISVVQGELAEAKTLFETYEPYEVAKLRGKEGAFLRATFISLAEILDDYNNGLIGPGHCSE